MTRNEEFNHRMVRLDALAFLVEKDSNFSDRGLGVDRVVDSIDHDEEAETQLERRLASEFYQKLREAKRRLKKAGKRYLIRVLLLIVKNNYKRQESLKYVPERTYYLHREQLIEFFCCRKASYTFEGAMFEPATKSGSMSQISNPPLT